MADDTPIAVALKYDKEKDQAPRLVAKGLHIKAEKIREIARQYGVPIMKNVNLAGALYRVDIGQEVPEALYDTVAEVLNFVYALQRREREEARRQAAQKR